MPKKYIVYLTNQEREHLEKPVGSGRAHARELLYACILLKAGGGGWTDEHIGERRWSVGVRSKQEFALAVRHLREEICPQTECVRIGCDNLSTQRRPSTKASPPSRRDV